MWESRVVWPKEVSTGNTDNVSIDRHDTQGHALAVCDALKRDGLGGEGLIFPLSTCVREVNHGTPR